MEKENQKSDKNLSKMIEKYKNDLIGYYKKNNPEAVRANENTAEKNKYTPVKEQTITDTKNQTQHVQKSEIQTNEKQDSIINTNNISDRMIDDEAISSLAANGTIIIQVTTANGSLAVPGAIVLIYRPTDKGNILLSAEYTDESGKTKPVTLPTLPKELSEKPGVNKPYISYNIRTRAPGYFIVENKNVPIYDSIHAVQNVNLIPVPENYKGSLITEIPESGPRNL